MIIKHVDNTASFEIESDAVKHTKMQVLVGEQEGWDSHVMRVLTVDAKGYTPKHSHPWPHINYVISGTGTLLVKDTLHPLTAGSYAYVDEDTLHQFKNTGSDPLVFICIVPKKGHK